MKTKLTAFEIVALTVAALSALTMILALIQAFISVGRSANERNQASFEFVISDNCGSYFINSYKVREDTIEAIDVNGRTIYFPKGQTVIITKED